MQVQGCDSVCCRKDGQQCKSNADCCGDCDSDLEVSLLCKQKFGVLLLNTLIQRAIFMVLDMCAQMCRALWRLQCYPTKTVLWGKSLNINMPIWNQFIFDFLSSHYTLLLLMMNTINDRKLNWKIFSFHRYSESLSLFQSKVLVFLTISKQTPSKKQTHFKTHNYEWQLSLLI